MKVLITGITGFAGSHLTQHLLSHTDHDIVGCSLPEPVSRFGELFAGEPPTVYFDDIADSDRVSEILDQEQPDAVMHLAAHAQVAGAWQQGPQIMMNNVVATQVLMQAIHDRCPQAKVLQISSGDLYGKVSEAELPLAEDAELRPNNPYAVSKLAQEFIAMQYHAAFGMEVVAARPFNHIGPRQTGDFIAATVARQLAEIEAEAKEPVLELGNLDSQRDFLDVRDVVRAYQVILDAGTPGVTYNVCSGEPRFIKEIVAMLLELSSLAPELKQDPSRMRPSDTPVVYGDNSRLTGLGWKPEVDIRQSLEDVLDYWRQVVAVEAAAGSKD